MKSGTPKGIPLAKLPFIGLCEGAPLPGVTVYALRRHPKRTASRVLEPESDQSLYSKDYFYYSY